MSNPYNLCAPVLVLRAELSTGAATVRSLGACYAFCIAYETANGHAFADRNAYWRAVNEAIINNRTAQTLMGEGKRPDGALSQAYLERVKKAGWEIHDAACRIQKEERK